MYFRYIKVTYISILNKIVSTKKTNAIFLATLLFLGTIALSSPSFMVGDVQAQRDYGMDKKYNSYEQNDEMNIYDKKLYENSYEPNYEMEKKYNSYEPDYGKDTNKKTQIFPANKVAELGDRWWQWGFGLDTTVVNPFTELGQAGCDVGLQDMVDYSFL